ncbi:MAG: hypothetical protein J5I93_16235 [Pirellulaceae bacterium]|nr:hypothetical protein [Pirellulaceae bacterium]
MFHAAAPVLLAGHTEIVRSLAFSPNQERAVSGGEDRQVILWDLPRQASQSLHKGHQRGVCRVRFHDNGTAAFSADVGGTVLEWDLANNPRSAMSNPFQTDVAGGGSAVLLPGRNLLLAAELNDLVLRRLDQPGVVARFQGHKSPVLCVVVSPAGDLAVSGGMDHSVRVWDVRAGREAVGALQGHAGPVTSVAIAANGKSVLAGGKDGRILLWQV